MKAIPQLNRPPVPAEERSAETGPLPVPLVVAVISCGMMFRAFDGSWGQALSCLLNTCLLAAALWRTPPGLDFWRRGTIVFVLVAGAICWVTAITFLTLDAFPDYALGKLLSLISGFSALLIGALMSRGRRKRRAILDWLLLFNTLFLVAGLLFREAGVEVMLPFWTLERMGRFTGVAGNANVTAAVAACCAIIAVARLLGTTRGLIQSWGDQSGITHSLFVPLAVLPIGVVVITASRFTAVVMSVAILAYLFDWLIKRRRKMIWRVLAIGVAVTGAGWFLTSDLVLRQRFSSIGASNDDRLSAWSHLLEVAMQRPFTGYGLGTFSSVHAHFLTTPRFAQADWAWNSPHNLFLQLMLQGGLPYLALLLSAVGVGALQATRSLRGRWTRDHVLAVVVLIVLVSCAMVDLVLDMPAPVTLAMFLAGSLWGQAINRPEIGVVAAGDDPSGHEPAIGLRASHGVEHPV